MCGIAGFCNLFEHYKENKEKWNFILNKMNKAQQRRGPDDNGIYLEEQCGLAHVRLSILDLKTGHQPMIRRSSVGNCVIICNGEIYNMQQLKKELVEEGVSFETSSDIEVILAGYMQYGIHFVEKLNGVFAFALWDDRQKKLYLVRDRLGVKPLFYTKREDTIIFSSELKGIFQYPNVKPIIDTTGLCEIFALGPAKTYGKGVFQDIVEVLPAHIVEWDYSGIKEYPYWSLKSQVHEDSLEKTIEKTSYLIEDAVIKQMVSDVPISTFLSGGVDSSLVTSICAKQLQKEGKILDTFSFDFQDNHIHFQANAFQPSQDRPWVDKMVAYSKTNHMYLECSNEQLADYLYAAVDARDLPCMADVESSLLYFCSKVANFNKVALTGECADEIFGGYPWFHKEEVMNRNTFPWSSDMGARTVLLKDEVIESLPLQQYANCAYKKTISETPILEGETAIERRRREIAYLNLKWFMITLLDRMDRTSMYSGLGARVPLADYRIVEYIWNVPWDMKCANGYVKGLLRAAGESHLPKEVLYRKKSPYPKTYHPGYEILLGKRLLEVLSNPNAPIHQLVSKQKVEAFLNTPSNYGAPWYGQLMAGPQMLAYLLQVNYWLETYKIQVIK